MSQLKLLKTEKKFLGGETRTFVTYEQNGITKITVKSGWGLWLKYDGSGDYLEQEVKEFLGLT